MPKYSDYTGRIPSPASRLFDYLICHFIETKEKDLAGTTPARSLILIAKFYNLFHTVIINRSHTFPTYTFSRYFPAIQARRYSCSTSVASLSIM